MRYAILFHDTVVGHSTFEQAHVLTGLAQGTFEPTAAFERLRALLPPFEPAVDADAEDAAADPEWAALTLVQPAFEPLPLRIAESGGRLLNARVCGLAPAAEQWLVAAWITDGAFWRSVAER